MATRKVTLSLDEGAYALAESAARRAGLSTSAWLSGVARHEAIRTGHTLRAGASESAAQEAATDLAIQQAAEEHEGEAG